MNPAAAEPNLLYDNRSLFSDYYLAERLADHPGWDEDISDAFEAARELYARKRDVLPGMNEAQTEAEFVRPLLEKVLGFAFDVQTAATHQGKLNRPDYTLFLDEEAKTGAQSLREDEGRYYARAVAVADAKFWGRPLDRRLDDPREELSNANPSFQIVNYLVATGVDWGVLTNGQLWRLYYAKARSRVDTYFEVDLAAALEDEDPEAFRVFYQFFRAAAFRPEPQADRSFLEAVYEGSVTYGAELQDRLKELIFERIFLDLARGFIEQRRENGGVSGETPETLAEVYQGTLRLLYRLLFLLHAEARGLLPVEERQGYYQYSLTRLVHDVAERVDGGGALSRVSTDLWNDLSGLFRVVDRGDPELNVPRYNGGLFRQGDPRNAFLERHRIADRYLAPALDHLTRELDPESGQRRFIDYKSLDVEQLGSIYEGLLEFKLRVAEEDLAVVRQKGSEVYRPADEVDEPVEVIEAGEPYLENDKGERKATGSYYTPHYIVEYIVEHTLGPVLERRAEQFRELMAEIEPKQARLVEIEANLAEDPERQDAAVSRWQNERVGLQRELEPLESEAREALLGLRVCDPAMGSGHFLVYAVDWLAERLIALLNEFPDNPLLRQLSATRGEIVAELERQGVAIEAERLKDTNLLKRAVMKRCIYGVDLNPMATELAKLSLWLDSFTVGAPLSFLDHHLKTGNSLIGTTVDEVRTAMEATEVSDEAQQLHLFTGPFAGLLQATSLMRDVATRADATFADVEASAEKYAAFEQAMAPYKRVLDLWVARHFGVGDAETFLRQHGLELLQSDEQPGVHDAATYQEAARLSAEQRFFHWELEFPEVFVDLERAEWKEVPGFDAVVGNPPYGASVKREKEYLREVFLSSQADFDSYTFFLERAIQILRVGGMQAFIVPGMWLTLELNEKLRRLLLNACRFESLLEAGRVFHDAVVETTIAVLAKLSVQDLESSDFTRGPLHGECEVRLLPTSSSVESKLELIGRREWSKHYARKQQEWWSNRFAKIDYFITEAERKLIDKVNQNSQALGDVSEITQGLTAYDRYQGQSDEVIESRAFHSMEREDETYKLYLRGSDVRRYSIDWSGEWISYGTWLAAPREQKYFLGPRLLFREVTGGADRPVAAYTEDEYYYGHSVIPALLHHGRTENHILLAIVNSKLLAWYNLLVSPNARKDSFPKMNPSDVEALPVKVSGAKIAEEKLQEIKGQAQELYDQFLQFGRGKSSPSDLAGKLSHEGDGVQLSRTVVSVGATKMQEMQLKVKSLQNSNAAFKYLPRNAAFQTLSEVFANEIKYGQSAFDERSSVADLALDLTNHDVIGLQLLRMDSRYLLEVQLKLRDQADDWQSWQYEDDGRSIKREWVPAYRFEMDEQKARYYQFAFEVLEEFENFTSFPGGYTRTAQQKLMATKIPVYDPDVDLTPLVELRQELEDVERKIKRTDALIDQIVYKLYGLTEEEIAIVEGEELVDTT